MQSIKHLAELYFAGTISNEQEEQLLQFLSQGESSLALFRQWEKEWAANLDTDMSQVEGWDSLQQKLHGASYKAAPRVFVLRKWYIAAAAAVVLVLLGLATQLGMQLGTPEEHYYTCTAPEGSQSQIELPDGSKVWLNSGSELRYSTIFNTKNRKVELKGEGYFEVTKHDGALFTVKTNGYDVVVRGTKFNVSAYSDDATVTTTLIEGKVELNRGEDKVAMLPGETVVLDKQTGEMKKTPTQHNITTWIAGEVTYDNIQLEELVKILSRRFGKAVVVKSASLAQQRFTISLRNKEDINDVLDALSKIMPVKITKSGGVIYLE